MTTEINAPEDDYEAKFGDCALGDRLTALLQTAREANKLGEARVPFDTTQVQRLIDAKGSPKQVCIIGIVCSSLTVQPATAMSRKRDIATTETPASSDSILPVDTSLSARRLNPVAAPYFPPQSQVSTTSPIPPTQTQLKKAYDDGLARGYASALQEGYKNGFQQGRFMGSSEAKTQKKTNS